jgi:hypothetical protein
VRSDRVITVDANPDCGTPAQRCGVPVPQTPSRAGDVNRSVRSQCTWRLPQRTWRSPNTRRNHGQPGGAAAV